MEEAYAIKLDENGILRIEGSEEDYLILPASTITKIGNRLYQIVGTAANVHLMEIGRSIGRTLAEIVSHQMKSNEEGDIIEAIDEYLTRSGFGITKLERHGDHFDVIIERPPSLRYKGEGLKKCRFEAGIIKGILETLTNKKWQVQIDDSVNDEKCLIHVREMQ
ncbi:hypothetical protein EYM_00530 [Ignicoccus islandicus DSM 13165]|uniref:4-vinyl reductase 4VR domain-containing protein n=1 Tax=Ignicoccus islandicus DSM 13165 TaxID=940295 RepID=A0A0U3FQE1_9CREN|nr:hypothetical protein [Ignicoccus islandicus]ALU12119.1 hypothetical protein EYM_00530 [Ignicoccus islandicus DSM 13165]